MSDTYSWKETNSDVVLSKRAAPSVKASETPCKKCGTRWVYTNKNNKDRCRACTVEAARKNQGIRRGDKAFTESRRAAKNKLENLQIDKDLYDF